MFSLVFFVFLDPKTKKKPREWREQREEGQLWTGYELENESNNFKTIKTQTNERLRGREMIISSITTDWIENNFGSEVNIKFDIAKKKQNYQELRPSQTK